MLLNPPDWRCSLPITSGYVASIDSPFPTLPLHSTSQVRSELRHRNTGFQCSFIVQHNASSSNARQFRNEHATEVRFGSTCVPSDDLTRCGSCTSVYWCESVGGGLWHG